jgi:hypothetical protein
MMIEPVYCSVTETGGFGTVAFLAQRGPAARVPIVGIDEKGDTEGKPDKQHVGARNIAQHPVTMGRRENMASEVYGATCAQLARQKAQCEPQLRADAAITWRTGRNVAPALTGKVQFMQRLITSVLERLL